jgi:hypothetical protein
MMIGPRKMLNAPIHLTIRIPRALGPKLKDAPAAAVPALDEGDKAGQWVAVGERWVGDGWPRCDDELGRYVAEVEFGFGVAGAGAGYELAEEGGL